MLVLSGSDGHALLNVHSLGERSTRIVYAAELRE